MSANKPQEPAGKPSASQPMPQEHPRVTLDELRKKAQDVRNLAVSEARTQYTEVQETIDQRKKTVVAIGVGGIVLLACFAYFVGTNAGRSRAQREFDRIVRDPCGPFGPFGKDIDRT